MLLILQKYENFSYILLKDKYYFLLKKRNFARVILK